MYVKNTSIKRRVGELWGLWMQLSGDHLDILRPNGIENFFFSLKEKMPEFINYKIPLSAMILREERLYSGQANTIRQRRKNIETMLKEVMSDEEYVESDHTDDFYCTYYGLIKSGFKAQVYQKIENLNKELNKRESQIYNDAHPVAKKEGIIMKAISRYAKKRAERMKYE